MATQDRAILEKLDAILPSEEVRAQIQPIVERVRAHPSRSIVKGWIFKPFKRYFNAN